MKNSIDIISLFLDSFKDYLDEEEFYTIGSVSQAIYDKKDLMNKIKNTDLNDDEIIINYGKTKISFLLSELNTYIQDS